MTERTCTLDGCSKPHMARGYCHKHLARVYRNGSPDLQLPRVRGTCKIEWCDRPHKGHGYCRGHLQRWRKGADMNAPFIVYTSGRTCSEPGCNGKHHGKGLCERHYYLANKHVYKARGRAWMKARPEWAQARQARRRALQRVAITTEDRAISLDYRRAIANDPCVYCGAGGEHIDHVFPLSKGGTDHWWNLAMACSPCNLSKADRCGTWYLLKR